MFSASFVQSLFKSGKLKVFKNLVYFLDELNSYQWETDRTGEILDKPRKDNDHLCDSLRYSVFTYYSDKPSIPKVRPVGARRLTSRMFRRF